MKMKLAFMVAFAKPIFDRALDAPWPADAIEVFSHRVHEGCIAFYYFATVVAPSIGHLAPSAGVHEFDEGFVSPDRPSLG